MSKLSSYIKLLRPQQYYKNLLVFLGIIFSGELFKLDLYIPLVLGFFVISFISSINFIINDWRDIDADKAHPEKKFRPLASGEVSKIEAVLIICLLILVSVLLIIVLPASSNFKFLFVLILLAIFFTSQFYS